MSSASKGADEKIDFEAERAEREKKTSAQFVLQRVRFKRRWTEAWEWLSGWSSNQSKETRFKPGITAKQKRDSQRQGTQVMHSTSLRALLACRVQLAEVIAGQAARRMQLLFRDDRLLRNGILREIKVDFKQLTLLHEGEPDPEDDAPAADEKAKKPSTADGGAKKGSRKSRASKEGQEEDDEADAAGGDADGAAGAGRRERAAGGAAAPTRRGRPRRPSTSRSRSCRARRCTGTRARRCTCGGSSSTSSSRRCAARCRSGTSRRWCTRTPSSSSAGRPRRAR